MAKRGKAKKRIGRRGRTSKASVPTSKGPGKLLAIVAVVFTVVVVGFAIVAFIKDTGQTAAPAPQLTPEQTVAALRDEELRLARRLISEFPKSEQPLVLMGDMLSRHGDTTEATRLWEEALARNPNRADVYDKLATLAFETDEFEKAISLWRKGLEIDPNIPGVHNRIARSLTRLARYEEAIAEAEAELEISPNSALSYFLLGRAHQQLQEHDKAKQEYKKVIELEPNYTRAYYGLFNVCNRLKQREEARQYLEKFKQLDERDQALAKRQDETMTDLNATSLSLARLCAGAHELYGQTKNVQRMEELLQRALALQPDSILYLEKLVSLYGLTNQLPEALSVCERIKEIDPNNTACYLNIGKFSMSLKRFDEAERAFQKAIICAPRHYTGYQELARLYLRTGTKLPKAKALAEKAVELDPSAANYFILGWANDVNGNPRDALIALEHAMRLDPTNENYTKAHLNIWKREAAE
ncbi:MAG: tetratricopeptide repeat protein [Phycisphaerales bacterium]|nr:MAG: tetratricopeptide repeat protein [Phycisphaerales bacterium]